MPAVLNISGSVIYSVQQDILRCIRLKSDRRGIQSGDWAHTIHIKVLAIDQAQDLMVLVDTKHFECVITMWCGASSHLLTAQHTNHGLNSDL